MSVVAKVRATCKYETGTVAKDTRQVRVDFVAGSDEVNKEWSRYTPGLTLSMTMRGEVADRFDIDQEYLLTFEPVVAPVAVAAELPTEAAAA